MKINTLLFDLDGTLINTNDLIIASFTHTLGQYYPEKYSREDIIGFIGEPLVESFASVDEERAEEMVEVYRKHNVENHDLLVTEYEGVFETIKTLQENGFKLAIVTSKMRNTVEMGLKLTNLDQFFDVVVTVDDVENPKPNPEQLNKAMEQLGSSPEQAMMVGDSQFDIQAGKNAGVKTAAVSWSIKGRDFIEKQNPDYLLENMADLLDILGVK
ncbi:pyrophosphatase PpaX [Pseudalkalibacillus caeni]|uniref:Pyrophosphatase PpaX n=1 Tax=Exobacillus caeni TaxID=2574798 RepID=A0A5R9F687_9BACL|nr:pyrophosphatase PpaX [Pseudalkalibacillus caeni]TLS38531.1 pyrophosphatase PpaX [Pseudalkalibacillus caeni]